MTPETKALALAGLEMALAEQIGKIFAVLVASPDSDRGGRFELGLRKAIERYDLARQMIEDDEDS